MRFDGILSGTSRPERSGTLDPPGGYWLDPPDLIELVRLGPLVSIDLVVQDPMNRVLVGLRNNEPARDTWFVPGGRVGKGESLDRAFWRITEQELGLGSNREDARLLGVFEHFFETNFLEEPGLGTHYVVLAHALRVTDPDHLRFDDQHARVRWIDPATMGAEPDVHRNTQVYGRLVI